MKPNKLTLSLAAIVATLTLAGCENSDEQTRSPAISDNTMEKVKDAAGATRDAASSAYDASKEAVSDAYNASKDTASEAADATRERLDQAGEKLGEWRDDVRAQYDEWSSSSDRTDESEPIEQLPSGETGATQE